jgi:competence protein ComEC
MFWAVLAFSLGMGLGHFAWRPPSWWLAAALQYAAAGLFFLRRRPQLASALALAAFVFTGALAIQSRANVPTNQQWFGGNEESLVTAHVTSEGNLQSDGPGSLRQQVDLQTERIESQAGTDDVPIGVRLNIYAKAEAVPDEESFSTPNNSAIRQMPLLHYGQRVRFSAILTSPRNFHNPGAFDYVEYLREQGLSATASAKYSGIEILPGFSGSRFGLWRARARRSIVDRIHRLWPQQISGLMEAMAIGERSFVEPTERVDFQRSGTYHMLVVAGLHVGILAGSVLWILRLLGLPDAFASAWAMILIFGYAALTGEGAPVWRAALMFAVYLATRLLYRKPAMLNALAIAALCLLLADPNALFTASFQMTALCVLLIAGIAIPLFDQTIEPYARGLRNLDALAYDRSLPPRVAQFRLDLRLLIDRISRLVPRRVSRLVVIISFRALFGIAGLTAISITMQLGLALPMAYYFHRATSLAIPANLLLVPLLQLLMPAAALAIATSYISFWLANIPAALAGFALSAITQTVHWLGGMRIADIRVATPSGATILISASAILLAVFIMRRRAWHSAAAMALLITSATCVWEVTQHPKIRPGVLEMTAIDVGQGDSIFLAFPKGGTLLIDGGGLPFWMHSQMDIGEDVVSPYLWSRGISRLAAIALTHAHQDHMGGLPAIIANFRPHELWLPEGIPPDEIRDLLASAERYRVKVIYHRGGDAFLYSGAIIRVLAPDPQFPVRTAHRNDESLVMKITYGKTSALLEADAEKGTEKLISTEQPSADVLKVAHHGSASSTNADLLAAVRPRFAIISVGTRNVYHHPRAQVLERLEQAATVTYRTDINGATTFYLDGNTVISQPPDLH